MLKNIHDAAKVGSIDDLVGLVRVNKEAVYRRDIEGNTPLLVAANNGHLPSVQWLLRNGASLREENNSGHTALLLSALNGHLLLVQWLLQNGASLEEKDNSGHTALLLAAINGHLSLVQWLLQNGAILDERNDRGQTVFSIIDVKEPKHIICKIYVAFLNLLEAPNYNIFQEWLKFFKSFNDNQLLLGLDAVTDALSKKILAPELTTWQRTIGYSLILLTYNPDDSAIAKKVLYLIGHHLFTSLASEKINSSNGAVYANLFVINKFTPITNRTIRILSLLCLSFIDASPEVLTLRYQLFRTLMNYKTFVANKASTLKDLQQQLQAENPKREAKYFYALLYSLFKHHYKLVSTTFGKLDYFNRLENIRKNTWLADLSEPLHFYQIMVAIASKQVLGLEQEEGFRHAVYLALKNQAVETLTSLAGKFDFNKPLNEEYPLVIAIKSKNKKLLLWLLQEGQANIKFKRPDDNKDIFTLLREQGQKEFAEELKAFTHSAFTAAYEALEKNNLVEAKKHYESWCSFDINYCCRDKSTLLCLAARKGLQAACEWLMQAGADFSITDKEGNTPLMIAIENKQTDLVRWLFKQPLDLAFDKRNEQQKSVNDIAMKSGDVAIVLALFEYNNKQRLTYATLITQIGGMYATGKDESKQTDKSQADASLNKISTEQAALQFE